MTQDSRWPQDYDALIGRLPRIVEQSRLTLGGFSACVDVYLSLREAFGALHAATPGRPQGIAMLEELMRRAASGIGGELFIDWADGPSWIERHVIGRRAIGGTSAQAAFMLAELGAAALIALQDRSAGQLAALHPATLLATERGLAPARTVAPQGGERPAHYIFEFTAGETIGDIRVARSSRTIVRFGHEVLQRDAFFEQTSVEQAPHAGAGILCGFNEVAPGSLGAELDYAARLAGAWREAGLAFIHLELGDFSDLSARDESLRRLLPAVTSIGMSRSEFASLAGAEAALPQGAICLAERHGLGRVCIHADEWAFAVTRGDPEREREALMIGCLLASARAASGYFAVPDRLPEGARLTPPPLPNFQRHGDWSLVCCPAPYLERPAATIGLGDTFLAGTLLVLGGAGAPASAFDAQQGDAIETP